MFSLSVRKCKVICKCFLLFHKNGYDHSSLSVFNLCHNFLPRFMLPAIIGSNFISILTKTLHKSFSVNSLINFPAHSLSMVVYQAVFWRSHSVATVNSGVKHRTFCSSEKLSTELSGSKIHAPIWYKFLLLEEHKNAFENG